MQDLGRSYLKSISCNTGSTCGHVTAIAPFYAAIATSEVKGIYTLLSK